jgi:hypothetical protein
MSQAEPIGTGEAGYRERQEPVIEGPKPVSARISTHDIQMLYACNTNPDAFMQCILGALKDAGCPAIEGVLRLRCAYGKVFKMKTNLLEEQDYFEYLWLHDSYVDAIANGVAQA